MSRFSDSRRLNFTARQLYDLVLDVEKYPEFVPWCSSCKITNTEKDIIYAELGVSFAFFHKSYNSRIEHGVRDNEYYIQITQVSGPFTNLDTNWSFQKDGTFGCIVNFDIDFSFESKLANSLISGIYNDATKLMIDAFEKRARKIYDGN